MKLIQLNEIYLIHIISTIWEWKTINQIQCKVF